MAQHDGLMGLFLPGGVEIAVIVVVVAILLFGRRLPELGRSLGQSITEFRRGLSSGKGDDSDTKNDNQELPR